MKLVTKEVLTLAVSVVALSGCSLFTPKQMADVTQKRNHARADASGVSGIDQGRSHLRAGSWGSAIEAFNVALATGEDPATSYNGLGVAYARLGRSDLAYRFFKKAALSNPQNPVYTRNLAILMDSPGFDLAAMTRGEGQLAQAELPAVQAQVPRQAAALPPQPGKLHRDAQGQFSIVTQRPSESGSTGPMPQVASRNPVPKAGPAKMPEATKSDAEEAPTAKAEPRKPQRKTITVPAAPEAKAAAAS